MVYYYIFAVIALLIQLLLLVSSYRHLRFAIRKYRPRKPVYQPKAAVICPCKGIDTTFDRNINSLFVQDYPDYEIHFVVESTDDPAYARLTDIIAQQQMADSKIKAQIIVAGLAKTSAQKVHNLLTVCKKLPDNIKIFAFIDSDACLKNHFLTSLIYPLRRVDAGASTGYRWFVPTDSRLSSRTLSAINAVFASLLGPHRWNSAWGGAMAIRHDLFDKIEMPEVWKNALTDDYTLSYAVKRAGLHVLFAPACFVASYEQTSWTDLFLFARRQFFITKVHARRLWLMALFGFSFYVSAFWNGLAISLYLFATKSPQAPYAAILPTAIVVISIIRAIMRQAIIAIILPENRKPLIIPALMDIFLQPLLAVFTLMCIMSSARIRTITWRNIKYTVHTPDKIEISV